MVKPCKFCGRSDLYLDYDERYPNQYLDGQQYFAPDEDVPHFMACPDNPYNQKKQQEQREQQDRKYKFPPRNRQEPDKGPVFEERDNSRDGPVSRIEKDTIEIKATLKAAVAMIEWLQQAFIESGIKRKT